MSGTTAFLIAVSGVSLVCYWLMTRAQNRGAERRSSFDGGGADSTYSGGGSDGGTNPTIDMAKAQVPPDLTMTGNGPEMSERASSMVHVSYDIPACDA